jgi:hypothetical protein
MDDLVDSFPIVVFKYLCRKHSPVPVFLLVEKYWIPCRAALKKIFLVPLYSKVGNRFGNTVPEMLAWCGVS